jgi:hypothetical protein
MRRKASSKCKGFLQALSIAAAVNYSLIRKDNLKSFQLYTNLLAPMKYRTGPASSGMEDASHMHKSQTRPKGSSSAESWN